MEYGRPRDLQGRLLHEARQRLAGLSEESLRVRFSDFDPAKLTQLVKQIKVDGLKSFVDDKQPKIARRLPPLDEIASQAVEWFHLENKKYPENLADLAQKSDDVAVWPEGGFLKSLSKDPWGNNYTLSVPGRDGRLYEIMSAGPDGNPKTEDDISSFPMASDKK